VLKKNTSETGGFPFNYEKGICFYEEIHQHLIQCNLNNQAYSTGMEIITLYGLKYFLNKFRRKETVHPSSCIFPTPVHLKADGNDPDTGCSRDLILLLAEMIQSAGSYYGI
jgi:hypothetical protein